MSAAERTQGTRHPRVARHILRKLARSLAILLLLAAALVAGPPAARGPQPAHAAAGGWTTYHLDNGRTGNDTGEGAMNTLQSTVLSPGLDEKVQAEPLVYNSVVYTATENNTVYALDETSSTLAVLWSVHLVNQVAYNPYPAPFGCEGSHLGNTGVGITGTPVIDTAAGVLYALTLTADNTKLGGMKYQLYEVRLSDHTVLGHTDILFADIDPRSEGERGALTLANGHVYVPFGGRDGDCEPYHPVVVSVPAGLGTAVEWDGQGSAFCQTHNCQEAGVWASGGMVVDGSGNLLLATGNGNGGWNCTLGWDHSNGVIKLSSTLTELDHFAPSSWCTMTHTDQDMGSIAPVLLPPSSLLFQTAKNGQGWILDTTNLGNTINGSTGTHVPSCASGDAAFGASAWDGTKVYVPCDGGGVDALTVNTTTKTFTEAWHSGTYSPGPPIVAGGYVWATSQYGGTLHRINPSTGAETTYSMGTAARFNTPAADNNRIFVAQNSPSGIREFNFTTFTVNYTAMYPWYDRYSSAAFENDNVHVVNPNGSPVSFSISIPGHPGCTIFDTLAAGAANFYGCPNGFGGPVVIQASARVISTQRVQYYQSFNEVPAQPVTSASKDLWFTWFDLLSDLNFIADNIHVVNPGATAAHVTVAIPQCANQTGTIAAGAEQMFTCNGGYGAGVHVTSDVAVLASQRVQYAQSFNEVLATPASAASTALDFPWYDLVSDPGFQADNVHVFNPGSLAATVHVTIPSCSVLTATIAGGQGQTFSCNHGYGGPLTVTSDQPVLSAQRVRYYNSFNEVEGQAVSRAAAPLYFSWFDRRSSPGFYNDNVHVINPSGTPTTVTVTIPGCSPQSLPVAAGAEQIFTCAGGYGGPVVVSASGGVLVLAGQRVQYYQSFNEVSGQA